MKALMSLGALVGVVGLLLLGGMTLDIVPSTTVRLVEGYMPMQLLFEVGPILDALDNSDERKLLGAFHLLSSIFPSRECLRRALQKSGKFRLSQPKGFASVLDDGTANVLPVAQH